MTKAEVLIRLKEIKLPQIVSGFKCIDRKFGELNFITSHYEVGEYLAVYQDSKILHQGCFKNQKAMNDGFRKQIKARLNDEGFEIISIQSKELVYDN